MTLSSVKRGGLLRASVRHAVTNSPHYAKTIGARGLGDFSLPQLPVLTKRQLIEQWDDIVTDERLRLARAERHLSGESARELLYDEYRVVASGGTTGERAVTVYDRAAWEAQMSAFRWLLAVQDIATDTRVVGIGSPSPLHMTNRLFAELSNGRSDAPRLSVTTPLDEMVAALNDYRPDAVITYPSFIRQLAGEQVAGRLRIAPRMLCATAETLTQDVRDLARATWDAPVLNTYGATETGVLGTECAHTQGVHIAEDLVVAEVVDEENRPVPVGTVGHKLLITTLYNRTLPLIRYELSDLIVVAAGLCGCGRSGQRFASIQGRREDVLRLPARNGGQIRIHALQLLSLVQPMPAIAKVQFVPRDSGLLVQLALKGTAPTADVVNAVCKILRAETERLGAAVESLDVEAVDDIARSGTGAKQKLVATSARPLPVPGPGTTESSVPGTRTAGGTLRTPDPSYPPRR